MYVTDFSFNLPRSLIAQYPPLIRSNCRLLQLDGPSGGVTHGVFTDLFNKLNAGDLLVFNNTRVIPARIFSRKVSGGKVEILVERILDRHRMLVHLSPSKTLKVGAELLLGDTKNITVTIIARQNALFELFLNNNRDVFSVINAIGKIPLPPYIDRPYNNSDCNLYQTVYSEKPGAVAAPTAGLHFDQLLLTALRAKGIKMAFITLHIGAGTFQPVRVETIKAHVMHAEYSEVSQEVVNAVLHCKARGNRVIAVGTSSVRALEHAANLRKSVLLSPFCGETRIFITPGYHYQVVDALVTNFHLPQSTLIMLVAAFAGYTNIMEAYQQAIIEQYRFLSYGDAMFISYNPKAAQE